MTIDLDQREWNMILALLAKAPWDVANPLIVKISDQLRPHQPQQLQSDWKPNKGDGHEQPPR